jgi:hypothetical protein
MRILFAISILSFVALIWAAVAITRRIRASHKLSSALEPEPPEFSHYLAAATKDSNSSLPSRPASPQDPSAGKNKPVSQSFTASYDKITSTERG